MSVRRDPSGKGDIPSFGALVTALAATIGTGSIVGVATAPAGGPGAIFWMWIADCSASPPSTSRPTRP